MHDFFLNPGRLAAFSGQILPRLAMLKNGEPTALSEMGDDCDQPEKTFEIHDRVAVIKVRGALASRQMAGWRWFADQTYESLVERVEAAVNSPDVDRVLLSINSPGGTVTGCAEAATRLDRLSERKEIWAHCNTADSAAYWLASATNRIVVDPTGEVGSIGVIMTHFDISKLLEDWGVKVTHIFSGNSKADGSPYNALSDDAQARFQADIDYLRGLFVDNVAAYRGENAQYIHDTQAKTYLGETAVKARLADATGFFSDVLNEMSEMPAENQISKDPKKETNMAKTTKANAKQPKSAKAADDKPEKEVDGEEQETADDKEGEETADDKEGSEKDKESGDEEAAAQSASSEKTRISAILNNKEAAGRGELAKSLALDTNLTAAEAEKVLKAAPKESAKQGSLGSLMGKSEQPEIGADGNPGKGGNKLLEDMGRRFPKK